MRGDWLNGQRDDDTLVGSSGNDDLIGGGGSDLLLAAAGDDFILSDHDRTAADFEWEHLPLPNPFDALTGLIVTNELYTAAGAADMIYAGAGNDSVGAGLGDDVVEGESGDDVLAGWEGDDILLGGTGNDKLTGEFYGDLPEDIFGADYLDGGDGNDDLYGEGGADVLFGGAGDDRLYGHSDLAGSSASQYDGADHIEGDAGNDLLRGDAGDDFLLGGADNDTVYGDAGADLVYGGTGNDVLVGDYSSLPGGMDTLDGGDGNDYIIAGMDADELQGGLGADELQGGSASDDLAGGEGADRLFGDADDATPGTMGNDSLAGGAGDDQLVGGGGLDVLDGGDDNDSIFGDGDQIDAAYHGTDTVLAGAGDDYVRTYGGDDLIFGEGGADQLVGEGGADSIDGGAGDDLLFGDADVTPIGEQGDDVMTGGEGNDQIVGYGGADTLDGGAGIDTLAGGMGGDVYLFGSDSGQSLIYDEGGDGLDAVLFSSDVRPDEITATRGTEFPNDLVLTIAGGAELTIANQFSMNTTFRMEEIRFSDGTVWTPTTVPLLVSGTTANNNLTGTAGPDVFEGLAGSDTLSGGPGNDTYRFRRGDGADTVVDIDSTPGNVDKVLFASDILPTDIRLSRSGDNLLLTLIGSTDRVTVTNYFVSDGVSANSVEQIKFLADGTAWDVAAAKLAVLSGTSSADTLTGYATHDVLSGFGGNDALVGNAGNDTLGGGSGNDIVVGGPGDDLYRFSRGHGADTISDGDATPGADRLVFASDIQPLDIVIARSFDDVVLSLPATGDQIRLAGYFDSSGATRYAIESIEFAADGTVWDVNAIKTFLITPTAGNDTIAGYPSDDFLAGLGGSDLITGMAGNDTFEGGTGFIDTLRGMTGNDTYRFFVGDEGDTIDDIDPTPGNVDRLVFGPGILPSDIRATRDASSNALRLRVGTTADHVTIASYFGIDDVNVAQLIERIEFQDGTVWDASFVKALVNVPTAGNDNIVGYGTNDNLSGLEGDDGISGRSGNDTLDGGAGSDGLAGDGGSDTYLFGRNYGFEYINDWYSDSATTTDALVFAADVAPSQVTPTKYQDTALILTIDGTGDQVFVTNYFVGSGYTLEQIRFADGTIWTEQIIAGFFPASGTAGNDSLQGSGLSEVINGVGGNDTLRGGGGHDTINGGLGSDHLFGEDGNDRLIAGSGEANKASVSNHLRGGNGNDVLEASGKTDFLYGEAGNDILLGAGGRDWLEDSGGNNLISGGATLDDIWMGDQNDLVIAGTGGDFVDGDRDADGIRGHDILAFNKSDGKDPVTRLGSGSTISIGGGTTYSNLSLVRQGTSLLVRTGSSHYMTLSNWYGSPAEKNVAVLQIVIEGTNNYNAGSSNPMNNRKIQAFDFLGLVAAFDAAGNPSNFNVANNLANFRLWGSDTDAIGGAIAYQYARTGSISSLTHDQMRAIVSDPAFGDSAQSITASAGLSAMVEGGETAMQERDAAELSAQALLDAPSTDASGARMPAQTTNHEVEITGSGLISHGSPSGITPGSGVTSGPGIGLGQGYDSGPSNVASAGAGASERIAAHEPSSGMQDIGWHRSSGEGRAPEEDVDAIAASWFTRRSLHEDLSLLDDIRRGEDAVELASSSSVAAAWEASHRWLSRPGGAAAESGGDDAGADLAGLSLFATGNTAYYDMPRAAVGLQEVSGHSLKSFRGLREGLSVLGQV